MNVEQRVNDLFKGVVNGGSQSVAQLKEKLDYEERRIEENKTRLKYSFDMVRKINEDIQRIENSNVDFFGRIRDISNNSKIVKATVDMDTVEIKAETKMLYMTATNGAVYKAGRYEITFDPRTSKVTFMNLEVDCIRKSYWSDKDHHPHVSNTGSACLGNSSEMIAYLASEFEYQALFDILISFLEQANLQDCAGKHVLNWDKVDKETLEVIREGTRKGYYTDFYYDMDDHTKDYYKPDEEDEYDDHEGQLWCDICEEWHYEGDVQYVPSTEQDVCNNCIDDFYWCTHCEAYHPHDDVTYVESISEYVCDNCLEDNFFQCDNCGEWFAKDSRYLDESEHELCKECFDEREIDE